MILGRRGEQVQVTEHIDVSDLTGIHRYLGLLYLQITSNLIGNKPCCEILNCLKMLLSTYYFCDEYGMRDFNKMIPLWSRGGFLWLCSVINHTWLNKLFAAWFDSYQPDSFQRLHLNYNSNSNQCIFFIPFNPCHLFSSEGWCKFLCFPNRLEKVVELSTSDGLQSNLRRGRKRWERQLMVPPPE